MARRISTPRAVVVLLVALAAGAQSGVSLRDFVRDGRQSRNAPPSRTADPTPSPSRSPLGPGNVLAVDDFAAVGWHDTKVYQQTRGQSGLDYPCQQVALADVGADTRVVRSTSWVEQSTFAAAQTVAETTDQTEGEFLYRGVANSFDHCVKNPDLVAGDFDATSLTTITRGKNVARVWRLDPAEAPDQSGARYCLLLHAGTRVALVELFTSTVDVDSTGLPALTRSALARL